LDGNDRWEDIVAHRLQSVARPKSIVNQGISGDPVCSNGVNGGIDRLQRDVLAQAAVSHVILFLGTNDIANAGASRNAVISCYQSIVARVRGAGLKVYGATMIPRSFDATRESYRLQVNDWIRTMGNFDAV